MKLATDHGWPIASDGNDGNALEAFKNERDYIAHGGNLKTTTAAMDWALREMDRLRAEVEQLRSDLDLRNQTANDRKEIIAKLEVENGRLRSAANQVLARANSLQNADSHSECLRQFACIDRILRVAGLALEPSWAKSHDYVPSLTSAHMADCAICGHMQDAPIHREQKVSDACAECSYPRREHSYNGACYGICGDFVEQKAGK